jgi:C4-dicarboxylate-specific signal transduction histidine kinase
MFYGDEGDLLEILGNLADNACKWCRRRVVMRAYPADHDGRTELVVEVEDDGPGIPPEQAPLLLGRGQRADPSVAGHGIGLAVVRDSGGRSLLRPAWTSGAARSAGRWCGRTAFPGQRRLNPALPTFDLNRARRAARAVSR